MRNLLIILAVLFSSIVTAQQKAQPININGKDVYTLLLSQTEFENVGVVKLNQNQINSTTSIEKRMKLFIENTTVDFDAIMSRNGISAILMKYKNNVDENNGKVIQLLRKDVYLLATPLSNFVVVETQNIPQEEIQKPFNQIVENLIKSNNNDFEGLIIKDNKVDFIKYK